MTPEEHKKRAYIYTNLAYILADVINTYSIEIEVSLSKIGMCLKKDEKEKMKRVKAKATELRLFSKDLSSPVYKIEGVDGACEDSDWLGETLLLLIDRCGSNKEAEQKIYNFLKSMESELKFVE